MLLSAGCRFAPDMSAQGLTPYASDSLACLELREPHRCHHTTLLVQGNKGVFMLDLYESICQEALTHFIMSCCYECQPIQISESTTYQCGLKSYLLCVWSLCICDKE